MSAHILLVEDNAMISGALRVLLESAGFDVSIAETAAEAAACGTARLADVMLLDIVLPDGDGLSVLVELAASGMSPRSTFAMTGHGDAATRERCMSAGCRDVLVKPVPVRDLLKIVSEAAA